MDTEDLTISYAEMRDRVGGAQFGDVWHLVLTDDEQRALDAGFWESSSSEGHRLEEKAKAIESRRQWVDGWLAENGLIDPIVRQHSLDLPAVSLDRFNAAFLPVFGSDSASEPTEQAIGKDLERGDAKEGQHHDDP